MRRGDRSTRCQNRLLRRPTSARRQRCSGHRRAPPGSRAVSRARQLPLLPVAQGGKVPLPSREPIADQTIQHGPEDRRQPRHGRALSFTTSSLINTLREPPANGIVKTSERSASCAVASSSCSKSHSARRSRGLPVRVHTWRHDGRRWCEPRRTGAERGGRVRPVPRHVEPPERDPPTTITQESCPESLAPRRGDSAWASSE